MWMETRIRHPAGLWRRLLGLLPLLALAACAHAPVPPPPDDLFRGTAFPAPAERISADDVFALSDEMRQYLRTAISPHMPGKGRQAALFDALYKPGQMRLEYDATMTRNAAQAFEARAGNCLSLVILTTAFAKALDLQVSYQSAFVEDTWSRHGNLLLRSGHVNVTLGRRFMDAGTRQDSNALTIDFLPPEDLRGLRTTPIGESTVMAMYMNNRAAEALADGRLADAHGWAREAIRQEPGFLSAYNTLGVIYLRHGDREPAERVFRHVLAREPANTRAMSNLAQALDRLGRGAEAQALRQELARIEPNPPFHFFQQGLAAMRSGDFQAARDLFTKEAERDAHYHEFQFWLALAHYRLGDVAEANKHLARALDASTSRGYRDLYVAKLAWLRAQQRAADSSSPSPAVVQ
jgi:tetratricopeptide (TPR) repeat protein